MSTTVSLLRAAWSRFFVIVASVGLGLATVADRCEPNNPLPQPVVVAGPVEILTAPGPCSGWECFETCWERDVGPLTAVQLVRGYLHACGFADLRLIGTTLTAQRAAGETFRCGDESVHDVVLGPASLATAGVCSATSTPEPNGACVDVTTAGALLRNCPGVGTSRDVDGTLHLEGLYRSARRIDASTCGGQHNGCGVVLEVTGHQEALFRILAVNDDASIPAGIRGLVQAIRADPFRRQTLAQLPACVRTGVGVRAGYSDVQIPPADPAEGN